MQAAPVEVIDLLDSSGHSDVELVWSTVMSSRNQRRSLLSSPSSSDVEIVCHHPASPRSRKRMRATAPSPATDQVEVVLSTEATAIAEERRLKHREERRQRAHLLKSQAEAFATEAAGGLVLAAATNVVVPSDLFAGSIPLLAAEICERVRLKTQDGPVGGIFGDATNYNTCVMFLEKLREWKMEGREDEVGGQVERRKAKKKGQKKTWRKSLDLSLKIVFHGTSKANTGGIIDKNLLVPDGRAVKVCNGSSYGKGIYMAVDSNLSFRYSRNEPIFACLAIVGTTGDYCLEANLAHRMAGIQAGAGKLLASAPADHDLDSFYSAGSGGIFVLQDSSQVRISL